VLWANRFAVDLRYVPRLAIILLTSACATSWGLPERAFFALWRDRRPVPPPLFVVGHFRSGTTLLHNLLARDPMLAFPTNLQVFSPHGIVSGALFVHPIVRLVRFVRRRRLTMYRPMDDMPVALDDPQEEEFAMAAMGAPSPYWKYCFPRNAPSYDRFISLDRATPHEREGWARALRGFVRKLTIFNGGRRLVLKSPYNTARVRHLLELFPGAQFIHIRRHPYDVVRSQARNLRILLSLCTLHVPPSSDDPEIAVASEYAEVEAAFQRDAPLLHPGRSAEVTFEDLEQDPVGEIKRIYRDLGLAFHPEFERRLTAYARSLSGYRKNPLAALSPDVYHRVAPVLRPLLQRWGYVEPEPIDVTQIPQRRTPA